MNCKGCKWWEQESLDGKPLDSGLCRRFPPQGFAVFEWTNADKSEYKATNYIGQWQNMFKDQWCGEFKKKDEKH